MCEQFSRVWSTESAMKMVNGHKRIPASVRTTLLRCVYTVLGVVAGGWGWGLSALTCEVTVTMFEAACCGRWLDDIVTVNHMT